MVSVSDQGSATHEIINKNKNENTNKTYKNIKNGSLNDL